MERAIEAAWQFCRSEDFDVPFSTAIGLVRARCSGVDPAQIRAGFDRRFGRRSTSTSSAVFRDAKFEATAVEVLLVVRGSLPLVFALNLSGDLSLGLAGSSGGDEGGLGLVSSEHQSFLGGHHLGSRLKGRWV